MFLARLLKERGQGPATTLLSTALGAAVDVAQWRPLVISGRRVSFARELLRVVASGCGERSAAFGKLKASAESMLDQDGALDVHAVTTLLSKAAAELRRRTGEGMLLLVDEMGRFLEHAASKIGTEDPSIFQALAERSGARSGADLAVVGILHHRFVITSPAWADG